MGHVENLTRWVLRHKLMVVAFWAVVTVIGFIAAPGLSGVLSKDFSLPGQPGYEANQALLQQYGNGCLLYTSPSPRDRTRSRMPSSA